MNKSIMRAAAICVIGAAPMLPATTKTSLAQTRATGDTTIVSQRGQLGPTGGTLEGNVVIKGPDIELQAQRVTLKRAEGITQEIRAEKDLSLKVSMAPRGAGAPTRIETTCDVATLDPVRRKLTLRGKVNGWYEIAQRGRTRLNTDMAVLYYNEENLMVDLTGGVRIDVPAETNAGAVGSPGIGAVTITARDASLDEGKGIARFTGNARAVSDDTPNKFDVSAPEFVLTRDATTKTIDTIKTSGRTLVKMDLPPQPATTTAATVNATGSTPGTTSSNTNKISRPTHVEVSADSATVTRATSTLVFAGNVKGFYELSPAVGETEKYNFSGDRADITFVPESVAKATNSEPGLRVNIEGNLQVALPSFDFGSSNK